MTLENQSLEGNLTFGDPFSDSGVVGERQREKERGSREIEGALRDEITAHLDQRVVSQRSGVVNLR